MPIHQQINRVFLDVATVLEEGPFVSPISIQLLHKHLAGGLHLSDVRFLLMVLHIKGVVTVFREHLSSAPYVAMTGDGQENYDSIDTKSIDKELDPYGFVRDCRQVFGSAFWLFRTNGVSQFTPQTLQAAPYNLQNFNLPHNRVVSCCRSLVELGVFNLEAGSATPIFSAAIPLGDWGEFVEGDLTDIDETRNADQQEQTQDSDETIRSRVSNIFNDCIVRIDQSDEGNSVKSNTKGRLEAGLILLNLPDPPWNIIRQLITPLTVVASIASLISLALQLLG